MLVIPIYITTPWYKSPFLYVGLLILLFLLVGTVLHFFPSFNPVEALAGKNHTSEAESETEQSSQEVEFYGVRFMIHQAEQLEVLEKFVSIVENNLDNEELGIPFIASELHMSTRQFYRKFNEMSSDISPNEFIKLCRLEKAADLLKNTSLSILEIISMIGINSRSYFYKEFIKKFGCTPKDFRNVASSDKEANGEG